MANITENKIGINHFLKYFREKRNLTIEEAAKLINISAEELELLEKEKKDFSDELDNNIDLINRFVETYKMSLRYFTYNYSREFNEEAVSCASSKKLLLLSTDEKVVSYIVRADSLMDFYGLISDVDSQDFLYLFKEYFSGELSVERVASTIRNKIIGNGTGPIYAESPTENLLKIIPFVFFDKVDNHEHAFDFYYLFHGMYFFNSVISNEISYNNQLFTIIHILGHVLNDIIEDDREDVEDIIDNLTCLVLIPKQDLLDNFGSFKMNEFSKYKDTFNHVSEKYFVTYKTIANSLFYSEIISKDEVNSLINLLAMENNGLSFNELNRVNNNDYIDELVQTGLSDGRINSEFLNYMTNGTNSFNKMLDI